MQPTERSVQLSAYKYTGSLRSVYQCTGSVCMRGWLQLTQEL